MAISTVAGPAEGPSVLVQSLADVGRAARFRSALLPRQPKATRPLPIYALAPSALSSPEPLAAVQLAGWRYLIKTRGNPGVVDLSVKPDGTLGFHALREAGFAFQFAEACATAEGAAEPSVSYEARVIKLPSLHLDAVWLASPGADLFVSIHARREQKPEVFDLLGVARDMLATRAEASQRSAGRRDDRGG